MRLVKSLRTPKRSSGFFCSVHYFYIFYFLSTKSRGIVEEFSDNRLLNNRNDGRYSVIKTFHVVYVLCVLV